MASVFYNNAKAKLIGQATQIDLLTDTIRAALLMTNTTAGSENDNMDFVNNTPGTDSFTTLDDGDDTGTSRLTLGTKSVNTVDASDRAEFHSANLSWTGLSGDATRDYRGVLIYKFVTNDAASIPIGFWQFATDVPSTATQVDVAKPTNGWFTLS